MSVDQKPYIVSNKTYIIVGQLHKGQQQSIVYDADGEHKHPISSSRIIRSSAKHYGHTLSSLATISRQFFGYSIQKLPLCLTTSYNGPCVFFPLWSARTATNIWVNANAVTHICQEKDGVRITLKHGHEVLLPVQYLAFCSLYSRAILFSNYIQTHRYL